MKVAWVAGANGFIGRYLSRYLKKEGFLVGGLGRGEEWSNNEARLWGIDHWIPGTVESTKFDYFKQIIWLA